MSLRILAIDDGLTPGQVLERLDDRHVDAGLYPYISSRAFPGSSMTILVDRHPRAYSILNLVPLHLRVCSPTVCPTVSPVCKVPIHYASPNEIFRLPEEMDRMTRVNWPSQMLHVYAW